MASELPESPFELPERTRGTVAEELSDQTRRVVVQRSTYVHAPMTECWRVVVDGALVIAEMQNREWANSVAVSIDALMPDGLQLPDALDEALRALMDLVGARYLIASVLENAAQNASTDLSPAAALVEAADRMRSGSR